jgi:hypothetical protein
MMPSSLRPVGDHYQEKKMYPNRMPLKPFLDTITSMCEKLPREDMLELILSLARKVPQANRSDFLSEIESCLPDALPEPDAPEDAVAALIEQISGLEESILERIESIENGDFWDEADHWEDGYDCEDPDDLSQDHIDELCAIFDEAGGLFLNGLLVEACRVYASLFELIRKLDERTNYYFPHSLDLREERARYCRCILETGSGTLTDEFIQAMEIEARTEDMENSKTGNYPLIQDIIDARPERINDLPSFLRAWRAFLSSRNIRQNRTADLLLEVVFQMEGLEAVARLARSWQETQPRAYIFWIARLVDQKEWDAAIKAVQSALPVLPADKYREKVSAYLIEAASATDDGKTVLMGKRERFFSRICDENLKDLMAEAVSRNVREAELEKVLRFIGEGPEKDDYKRFEVRLLLMAGSLKSAFEKVKKEPGIGWSEGSAGVVFGSILSTATGHADKAAAIQDLLRHYSEKAIAFSYRIAVGEDKNANPFCREIVRGLQGSDTTAAELSEMIAWAMKIGEKRIDGIVSNKRRGAYDRAAQVLGCLGEALAVMGKKDESKNLLRTYYNVKYNRFSAFRSEVRQVVKNSPVLRGLGLGF